jgi:hypothetical protein
MGPGDEGDAVGTEARLLPRCVRVGGRTTAVRLATPGDVEAVLAHYRRLGPEDLHRRFLSTFRPERGFVEGWLDRADRGGGAVLLAVEGDATDGPVVADAGYVPTGDDAAEFAITVAPTRRGWLGPYLLDLLVTHARDAGVAVLTAEVLAGNVGMLALARSRGCAFRPTGDPTILEVVLGTAGPTPTWPSDGGARRLLIEGSAASWPGSEPAAAAGIAVLACPGPGNGRTHPCPHLRGEPCPLVGGADAVLVALPPGAATTRELLAGHAAAATDQPLAVTPALCGLVALPAERRTFAVEPEAPAAAAIAALRAALDDPPPAAGQPGRRAAT